MPGNGDAGEDVVRLGVRRPHLGGAGEAVDEEGGPAGAGVGEEVEELQARGVGEVGCVGVGGEGEGGVGGVFHGEVRGEVVEGAWGC